jgi:hypothetical protein
VVTFVLLPVGCAVIWFVLLGLATLRERIGAGLSRRWRARRPKAKAVGRPVTDEGAAAPAGAGEP